MTAFTYNDLLGFVRGLEVDDLEAVDAGRVAGSLSQAWAEGLERDLSDGVLKILRMERFVADVARTGADIVSGFGSAAITYAADAERSRVDGLADEDVEEA